MRCILMKYQVWVTTDKGLYQCLKFDTAEKALFVIKNLKEYEYWNFTI
jgi:hypothetical protein